ncbi:PepSY-associated TM helix domain-containing protein [Sphingomonas quercus]|uniref:PepSY domain-containing protein n=1 Tax=Sphingomonas quercus TaxID=2842451 RepID=A0ABS6BH32_9SPHN|nr:PepSY-associated TM helix domain-containing protein [Sphingomonas quercus]MBU3077608.1 PepSY domain-containing protein [Sphingomonas quercus]
MKLAIPRAFTRALLDAHSTLGIVFAALFYLVCFSGTVAVLADEFAQWERPDAPRVTSASDAALIRAAAEGYARARAGGSKVETLIVTAPSDLLPRMSVTAYDGRDERTWSVDAAGHVLPPASAPWAEFVREHHHSFNIPDPFGRYLVGIIGTVLIASLISGLLAHRRIIRDAFRLRRGGAPRLAAADLHNRLGVWGLPFHLIVALTGSLLGLAGLIIGVLALVAFQGDQQKAIAALTGPGPTADRRAAPLPDMRPMLATIAARSPGAPVTSVLFLQAGTRGQIVSLTTAEPAHLARNEGWTFSPEGRLLAKAGFTDGGVGMRIYGMITPLHYGTYGGLPLKLIYVLLGSGLTTIIASGMSVWFHRRREQGRPAPLGERLWEALVWAQPAAYAASAIGVLLLGWPPLPLFWGTLVGALALSNVLPDRRMVRQVLRAASGGLMILAATAHAPSLGAGWLGVGIDLVAALLGVALLYRSVRAGPLPGCRAERRRSDGRSAGGPMEAGPTGW